MTLGDLGDPGWVLSPRLSSDKSFLSRFSDIRIRGKPCYNEVRSRNRRSMIEIKSWPSTINFVAVLIHSGVKSKM